MHKFNNGYIDYYKRDKNNLIYNYLVYKHNKKIIKKELLETKNLLDNINGYPLDLSQRKAVLTDEISTLLVAGAGSGKTLTIIGKIRYLIEVKKINPSEILCISFTREATNSLKNKLITNYNYDIDVLTFHKLALNIIKEHKTVNICNDNLLEYIVNEYFYILKNEELIKYINKYNLDQLKKLIITFINLFKCNNHNIEKFLKIKADRNLISIIVNIYLIYENELKSTNSMDFNDLIKEATLIVKKFGISKKYRYIIIDEYQDTSYARYLLIKSIIDVCKSKILVVGDDWQSIYRFSGCSLNMFIDFKKYFKKSKILYINNTYRNSLELIKVTSKFIMKNKNQIIKNLNSNKRENKPIKIVNEGKDILYDLIKKLGEKILVLGRNNNDIKKYFDVEIDKNGYFEYKDIKARYLTVHRSKGLEEENVIIINLYDKANGFPNKMKEDDILNEISLNIKNYPYDEERRLFYVALTRTKNCVYLIVPKNKSMFIKELELDSKKYIEYID